MAEDSGLVPMKQMVVGLGTVLVLAFRSGPAGAHVMTWMEASNAQVLVLGYLPSLVGAELLEVSAKGNLVAVRVTYHTEAIARFLAAGLPLRFLLLFTVTVHS